ncbi:MAG: 3-keto-disaccharide hydrolase [Planctomycetota bacterium]|jgi:hypothetical protein
MKYKIISTALLTLLISTTLMCSLEDKPTAAVLVAETKTAQCATTTPASVNRSVLADIKGPRPEGNGLCLVCHASLAEEEITLQHLKQGIMCIDCHGRSTEHMEDEMLNTTPDIKFGRIEVKPFCQGCHEEHKHPTKVLEFLEKWRGKDRAHGRVVNSGSICTDCHGLHTYQETSQIQTAEDPGQWIPLFNGKDLTGWKKIGTARWTVENGTIVGVQGKENTGGDLLTEATYKDFLLTVTYKVQWPANTGIWFRYQSPKKAYQADILEHPKPEAYSGTIYCPGKLFIATNLDKNLVDREGWNTISIRAEGTRLQVWLNGHQVADVKDDTTDSGQIGVQVHQGKHFETMKVVIREIAIKPLGQ